MQCIWTQVWYVCMYLHTDPMFDVMQTITEPTGDDISASPTPGSDDGQEHTVKRGGQEGLNSHFKKRKPMKPTSRTSINNIVDNKMEHDEPADRQVNNISTNVLSVSATNSSWPSASF